MSDICRSSVRRELMSLRFKILQNSNPSKDNPFRINITALHHATGEGVTITALRRPIRVRRVGKSRRAKSQCVDLILRGCTGEQKVATVVYHLSTLIRILREIADGGYKVEARKSCAA